MDKKVRDAIITFGKKMAEGRSDYAITTVKSLPEPDRTNGLKKILIKCLEDGKYEYSLKAAEALSEPERTEITELLKFYEPACS